MSKFGERRRNNLGARGRRLLVNDRSCQPCRRVLLEGPNPTRHRWTRRRGELRLRIIVSSLQSSCRGRDQIAVSIEQTKNEHFAHSRASLCRNPWCMGCAAAGPDSKATVSERYVISHDGVSIRRPMVKYSAFLQLISRCSDSIPVTKPQPLRVVSFLSGQPYHLDEPYLLVGVRGVSVNTAPGQPSIETSPGPCASMSPASVHPTPRARCPPLSSHHDTHDARDTRFAAASGLLEVPLT